MRTSVTEGARQDFKTKANVQAKINQDFSAREIELSETNIASPKLKVDSPTQNLYPMAIDIFLPSFGYDASGSVS